MKEFLRMRSDMERDSKYLAYSLMMIASILDDSEIRQLAVIFEELLKMERRENEHHNYSN